MARSAAVKNESVVTAMVVQVQVRWSRNGCCRDGGGCEDVRSADASSSDLGEVREWRRCRDDGGAFAAVADPMVTLLQIRAASMDGGAPVFLLRQWRCCCRTFTNGDAWTTKIWCEDGGCCCTRRWCVADGARRWRTAWRLRWLPAVVQASMAAAGVLQV